MEPTPLDFQSQLRFHVTSLGGQQKRGVDKIADVITALDKEVLQVALPDSGSLQMRSLCEMV